MYSLGNACLSSPKLNYKSKENHFKGNQWRSQTFSDGGAHFSIYD